MKITVRYFASLREAIGQSQEDLHTLASHAGEVRDELLARGGGYACLSRDRSVRLALNQAMVEEDAGGGAGDSFIDIGIAQDDVG